MAVVAFDTETGGLDWFEPDQQAFLITWADAEGEYAIDVRPGYEEADLERFVRAIQAADEIVGHNLPFDIHMVRATTGVDILRDTDAMLWDTHTLDVILFPEGQRKGRGGHGLEAMTEKLLGRGRKADDVDELGEAAKALGGSLRTPGMYRRLYEEGYRDLVVRYALGDARDTYDLYQVMLGYLKTAPANLQRVVALEHELMPVVIRAEQRGVAVDQDEVRRFKAKFENEERLLREKLSRELGGAPASDADDEEFLLDGKGSQAALREALIKVGVPLTETTADGRLSTSRAALMEHVDNFPVIADLFEWRRVKRFLNTYIGPMVGRDVIHTSYQVNEPWTGRMSSRRPNMQNWPRRAGQEVRNVLQARPGHSLLIADYSQMEAMIIVRYLNDPGLIEAMDNGLDLNAWTAAKIWGGEVADWGKDTPNAEGERSRATARHTLYATLYGAGAKKVTQQLPFLDKGPFFKVVEQADGRKDLLVDEVGHLIPTRPWKGGRWPKPGWQYEQARQLQRAIKNNLPGYYDFVQRLGQKIDEVGYVNTIYGRQNPVPKDKKYVAVAAIVQGTGADILKLAAVKASKALRKYKAELVMFTHDELVAEARDEVAEPALTALVQAMESACPEHRPRLRVEGAVVKHYGEGH